MTDRLEQIWASFSKRTHLDVSATDITSTPRPSLSRRPQSGAGDPLLTSPMQAAGDAANTPTGQLSNGTKGQVTDPVAAALSTLHTALEDHQRTHKGRRHREGTEEAHQRYSASAHPHVPDGRVETSLLADLAFTRSKTERTDSDYITYAAARQDAWQKKRRKWFFGLF